MQVKVSVIIPVYNAEPYIENCVRTLFGQTLDNLEFIFIDDCSPDNSISVIEKILEEYPARKDHVIILRNEQNRGVGQTRQRGIDNATGEYIIHCDPDDWIETHMYEALYSKAIETNADIVICDFFEEYDNHTIIVDQPIPKSRLDIFHQIATEQTHCSLCNKLVKSNLAKSIRIEKGINLWEDLSLTAFYLVNTNKVERIASPLYHYNVINLKSITHGNRVNNAFSKIHAIKSLENNLDKANILKDINGSDLHLIEWKAKRGLLSCPNKTNIDLWIKTFPDSNNPLSKGSFTIKNRILSFFAKNNLSLAIKAYNFFTS